MSATAAPEAIAGAVADIRAGTVLHHISEPRVNATALDRAQRPQPVVDVTRIYQDLHHQIVDRHQEVAIYEDHPCVAPAWNDAILGYVNEAGNTVLLQMHARPWSGPPWVTPNEVEWGRLRWLVETFVWGGGYSRNSTQQVPITGPLHLLQYAVYPDGEPADLHYVHLIPNLELSTWDFAQLTLLSSLAFLNCRNVDIDEPARPRAQRRRLARSGVAVNNIVVRPVRRRRPSGAPAPAADTAVPVTRVRGHFAHYGPEFGKGLLFGKISGRFWIPETARGASAAEPDCGRTYILRPSHAPDNDQASRATADV